MIPHSCNFYRWPAPGEVTSSSYTTIRVTSGLAFWHMKSPPQLLRFHHSDNITCILARSAGRAPLAALWATPQSRRVPHIPGDSAGPFSDQWGRASPRSASAAPMCQRLEGWPAPAAPGRLRRRGDLGVGGVILDGRGWSQAAAIAPRATPSPRRAQFRGVTAGWRRQGSGAVGGRGSWPHGGVGDGRKAIGDYEETRSVGRNDSRRAR